MSTLIVVTIIIPMIITIIITSMFHLKTWKSMKNVDFKI